MVRLYGDVELADDGDDLFSFGEDIINDAIAEVFKGKGYTADMLNSAAGRAVIGENYRILSDAVDKGIRAHEGSKHEVTGEIRHEVNPELTAALKNNAFLFSGWKAHRTMEEAGLKLHDEKGGIKSFEKFKREAGDVFKKQGLNLRAEYMHAVQTAEAAAQWAEIEEDGDRYDLQYRTVGDDKVRKEHARLNGTTLPPSDDFWKMFYPPNGWGCRCTVAQVRKGKYESTNTSKEAVRIGMEDTSKPNQKMFRTNAGQTKKVFPRQHPNFPKGCGGCTKGTTNLVFDSNSAKCKACMSIDSVIISEGRKAIRNHYQKLFNGGSENWKINNGDVDVMNVSYQDIKNITGKPHNYRYARDMAVFYLEKIAKQAKYLGSSPDIKRDGSPGHSNVVKWHYFEFDFLQQKSYLQVKEYADGIKSPHCIQDKEHFDYDKIQNKTK